MTFSDLPALDGKEKLYGSIPSGGSVQAVNFEQFERSGGHSGSQLTAWVEHVVSGAAAASFKT